MAISVNPLNFLTFALVLTLCNELIRGQDLTSCVYDATFCGCQTDKGLISLRKYEEKGLSYFDQQSSAQFDWNPCKDFQITGLDTKAACIQSFPPILSYDCGMHATTTSSVKDGKAEFRMESADKNRKSVVKCICKDGENFKYISETPIGTYYFEFAAEACCPVASASSSKGLSGGSILLIAFFCLVFVYIVAGVAVQVGLKKAEGKERIPNVTFWEAVPGLIKDGFRFTLSCGKRSSYTEY